MIAKIHRANPFAVSVGLGVLAGLALSATALSFRTGQLVLVPYLALAIATVVYLRTAEISPFSRRFALSLVSFLTATILLLAGIQSFAVSVPALSVWGGTWRLLVATAMGAPFCVAVAALARSRHRASA